MLSLVENSLTVAEADEYAGSRGRTEWINAPSSPEATKLAAIRRGTDFIAGAYNSRWMELCSRRHNLSNPQQSIM